MPGIFPTLQAIWKLLRGSVPHRFAATLVRWGAFLVGGPPLAQIVVLAAIGEITTQSSVLQDILSVGAFLVGILLILCGVWVFYKHPVSMQLPDAFKLVIPEGWSFRDVALGIVRDLKFEGFTRDQLNTPMLPADVLCVDERTALIMLGGRAGVSAFPQYQVIPDGPGFILRTSNVA